jgi:type IV secretion system protein VirD4
LDTIGDEKTALFIILPDTDKSFNFLAAMMFQQMFDTLVYRADNEYRGKLPLPVRCMMDEFANIGQIPMLEVLISTIRQRGISLNIVLQNLAQIESQYKHTWEIITGNCDSLLFLGGTEQSTLDYISKMCGKTTIDNRNINESHGQTASYSMNYQVLGRELITPDEAGNLKGRECILHIRGCRPFLSHKYDLEKHKNYRQLSDAEKSNWFVIEDRDKRRGAEFFRNVKQVHTINMAEPAR